MLGWIIAGLVVVAALVVLPWLLSLMPRNTHGGGGNALGAAMSGLDAVFNPAEQHMEAAKRQLPAERDNDEPKD